MVTVDDERRALLFSSIQFPAKINQNGKFLDFIAEKYKFKGKM